MISHVCIFRMDGRSAGRHIDRPIYIIYIDTDLYLVQIMFICRPAGPTFILNIHIIYISRMIGGSAGQKLIRIRIKYIQYIQDERLVGGSAGRQIDRG